MEIAFLGKRRSLARRLWFSTRKYWAILRVSIASNLAYVYEVVFRALSLLVIVFVLSQLWKTTFSLRSTQTLSGFSITDMIWYLVAAETFAMSAPPLSQRIDQEVRSGQLAYLLGRPCSYILYHFAQYLGERFVRLIMNAMVGAILALVIAGLPHFTWMGVLVWPLTLLLAVCIDFVAYFSIGLLAFWTEDTRSFALIYSRLSLVLGGVLAPIEIFPQPLRAIAQALPFSAILYGPARTLVRFDGTAFVALLFQQSEMIVVGSLLLGMLYLVVMRRVNINGG